jgi:hypothetical protein
MDMPVKALPRRACSAGKREWESSKPKSPSLQTTIRAELAGANISVALGITVEANAPVLELCRKLVSAGHDPGSRLEAFRDNVLCLIVARSVKVRVSKSTDTGPASGRSVAGAQPRPCVKSSGVAYDRPPRSGACLRSSTPSGVSSRPGRQGAGGQERVLFGDHKPGNATHRSGRHADFAVADAPEAPQPWS